MSLHPPPTFPRVHPVADGIEIDGQVLRPDNWTLEYTSPRGGHTDGSLGPVTVRMEFTAVLAHPAPDQERASRGSVVIQVVNASSDDFPETLTQALRAARAQKDTA
ncbi:MULTISPECIES: hypothetical protein [Streptomycetaceae]|uniref:Uncharacterized protein n=1 Tax=Streptantibioticus cattleyicolor (strain ATCC 35852 / DSM 46488 / JCM 4925 / NBRC 14057 / NRRL 8057) TaxID=1003195 RepID=F8JT21_STREN|nr:MULTISPECIES: hypothetical protein [Streptomycetaceae]AEW92956.1 hypothetical protein SCATT_05850 [Streptantibioticus cattleyicolor NRRL 8057 = DSM 46488]MYS57703.1 hypothetical protein [Streptomyces sp. SID5468]CCB73317.1 protein of unknown function [Streptantibioticus cattleyicolor NRRL 8057 = DSM 46488]